MKSINKPVKTEVIYDKSKFICTLIPINSNDYALKTLDEIRRTYHDATHNCYAYVINSENIQKCSDDGEPAKTAGYPILQVLINNDLDNVLCVVTRYFGGIKLGTGGLMRAYSNSALSAVNEAVIVEYANSKLMELVFDFSEINRIDRLLQNFNAEIIDKAFYEKVTYTINVNISHVDELDTKLINLTKNNIIINYLEESTIITE